jgi:hypothetical protein
MVRSLLVEHARSNASLHVRLLSRVLQHSQAALTRATNAVTKALPLLHDRMELSLPSNERKPVVLPSIMYIGSGHDNRGALRFDLQTQRWSSLPNLPYPFILGGITTINNTIVVAGGQYNSNVIALDLPSSPSSLPPVTVTAALSSVSSSSSSLSSSSSSSIGVWRSLSCLSQARAGMALVTCGNMIYAIGGVSSSVSRAVATCERLDITTGEWTTIPSMNIPRAYHTAATVDGIIIVTGGRLDANPSTPPLTPPTAEVYDPLVGHWKNIPAPALPRSSATCVVIDGLFIVMGGIIPSLSNAPSHACDTIEQYNMITRRWSALPWRLSHRRADITATYANNRLFIIGGHHDQSCDDVKCFSFVNGHWSNTTSLPHRSRNARCITFTPIPSLTNTNDLPIRPPSIAPSISPVANNRN